jgi:NTE family protein
LQQAVTADIQNFYNEDKITIATYGLNTAQAQLHPKIALVLSGGGARGFAHIPVIEAIERAGIPIDMVLGTSMGSLVGGLYAAGYSPGDIRRLIKQYDMVELFTTAAMPPLQPIALPFCLHSYNLFVLGFDKGGIGASAGLIGDQGILHLLNGSLSRVAGITDFDRLAIPFRCVGADLITGERIVFSSGSLVAAIRSSISIPGVFSPYPVEGQLVIDGGLVDNLPINLAKELGADVVIAVDVNPIDYTITGQELESLTAVFNQLVVILTRNTVVEQTVNADLVIIPELTKYGILDFMSVDAILEVGEESVRAHDKDFSELAEKIALQRPLKVRDPDRFGQYFNLPDVFIDTIAHRSLQVGSDYGDDFFKLTPFKKYIGLPLDKTRKTWLHQQLDELRNTGEYATVTYDYTNVRFGKSDMVLGTLEIQTRQFAPKRASIAAGAYGATAIQLTPEGKTTFEFRPDFALRYNQDKIFASPTSWSLAIANDDALSFSTQLFHEFAADWEVGADVGYTTGGIHPLNLRHGSFAPDIRDRLVNIGLLLRYHPQPNVLIQTANYFDYIWFGVAPTLDTFIPSVRFDSSYVTLQPSFFPKKGLRLDISAHGEGFVPFGYRVEVQFQQVFELGSRHALWYDLRAGSAHVSIPRQSSLLDYGGACGMPSYLTKTLVDDLLLARLKHLFWISDRAIPLILQTMVAVGSRGELMTEVLESAPYMANHGAPFSSLQGVEASISFAIGFSLGTVDFLVGTALDSSLRTSLFLEVR